MFFVLNALSSNNFDHCSNTFIHSNLSGRPRFFLCISFAFKSQPYLVYLANGSDNDHNDDRDYNNVDDDDDDDDDNDSGVEKSRYRFVVTLVSVIVGSAFCDARDLFSVPLELLICDCDKSD